MIPLYGCVKGGNYLFSLDDETAIRAGITADDYSYDATDNVYLSNRLPLPFVESTVVDFGESGAQGRLRRIAQAIEVGGDAVAVQLVPVTNGVRNTAEGALIVASQADDNQQILEHGSAAHGFQHAVRIEIPVGVRPVLGGCDLSLVPRRSTAAVDQSGGGTAAGAVVFNP